MGHEYVKENDVFSTDQNGVVPKPTASDIENNHVLKADHTWGEGGGSGEVVDVKVNGDSVLDENNEAQITSYKEVTMSEYNALPQSKETDGVLYCIKDAGGADAFPPLIFSDEEREIGVWRDGKPLYQKVFSLNNAEIQVDTFYEIPNTDKTQYDTYVYCYLIDSYGQAWCATLGFSGNNVAVFVHSNRTRNYNYAIIQYTKTTDTPGSGIWNQQGSYAHHYSTTEHIIGTWIDGKPIYEKTVDCGYLSNNSSVPYAHGISNLKMVISHEGSAMNSSGTYLPLPKVSPSGLQYAVDIAVTTTDIVISTGTDRTGYYAYVTLRYTKTTD